MFNKALKSVCFTAVLAIALPVVVTQDCNAQRLSSIESQLARRLALAEISPQELTRRQQVRILPTAARIGNRISDRLNASFEEAFAQFLLTFSDEDFDETTRISALLNLANNRGDYMVHQAIFEAPRRRSRRRSVESLVRRSFTNQPSDFEVLFGDRQTEGFAFTALLTPRTPDGEGSADGDFTSNVVVVIRAAEFDPSRVFGPGPSAEVDLTSRPPQGTIDNLISLGLDPEEAAEPPFSLEEIAPALALAEFILSADF